ncbi:MAG: glycosyltransferase [Saprospirales bacterium]|nr:glycosyltransferase [Saprospirales bacterium]
MLSILIPVYQFDVRPLVQALLEQASRLPEAWEIICLDDGSPEAWREKNREISTWTGVRYEELPKNIGRAQIRNRLAQEANFPCLLFMDCDGMPVGTNFLSAYLTACRPGQVVVGTRAYEDTPPTDPTRFFHWHYGRTREQRPAAERNRLPYDAFCTFHFLCPRELFLDILLDESLRQYGHEDTQFGYELRKRNIPVVHIDTALLHLDVEPTDIFLKKTRQGIENLAYLAKKNPELGSRLLQAYWKLRPLSWLLAGLFILGRKAMEWQFGTKHPSLRLFDFYKLGYLNTLKI